MLGAFGCQQGDLAKLAASHAMIHGKTADLKGSTAAILPVGDRRCVNTQQTMMTSDDDDDGVECLEEEKKGLTM